jgi:hypothetical protein
MCTYFKRKYNVFLAIEKEMKNTSVNHTEDARAFYVYRLRRAWRVNQIGQVKCAVLRSSSF